jgi:hypothetical protein
MSFGNFPEPGISAYHELLMAQADAKRAGRLAGHESLPRRLLKRLCPGCQPRNESNPATPSPITSFGRFIPGPAASAASLPARGMGGPSRGG